MKIEVSNKIFYTFLLGVIIIVLAVSVYAAYSFNPPAAVSNPGHTFECVSGRFAEGVGATIYNPSTSNKNYQYDEVFDHINNPSGQADEIYCIEENGWVATGCTSATQGSPADNDAHILRNGCRGDETGGSNNWVYARCCRVVGN